MASGICQEFTTSRRVMQVSVHEYLFSNTCPSPWDDGLEWMWQSLVLSCLVLSCRCHSDSDVRFVRSNRSVALLCISCLVCAWLASFLTLSQGSCRSFLGCLCISCKGCWTSYISSQAYRHNHTHTYTIIHADAREDMHTYNRTILGGQVRKSLVLWGAIQIRM